MKMLALLVALCLTGCGPNLKEMVQAAAQSDRSWCLSATGYGVDLKVGGSGVGDGDMSCGGAGLMLKSQGAQIGIPMTLVPQLSIGAPTAIQPPPQRGIPPAPRAIPQRAPGRADDVTLTPIAWPPAAPRREPTALSADERLLLFSIGDLHGLVPRPAAP
jgi:hypothetical protein